MTCFINSNEGAARVSDTESAPALAWMVYSCMEKAFQRLGGTPVMLYLDLQKVESQQTKTPR